MKNSEISREKLIEIYTKMQHTRKFDEKVAFLFTLGKVHGTTHLYVGEEATAAGVCCAMQENDMLTSTHRGHGHCISRGIDLNRMMAELLGKVDGYCHGKGGSMHIADLSRGNLGANGVVGGGHGIAVGAALTQKKKKTGGMTVCFFGDGAANEGSFYEAANLAAIWKLPVLFVCENNQYAMATPQREGMNVTYVSELAQAFAMPGVEVDGNDAPLVYLETIKAREYVVNHGPMLLVCNTYRYMGHSKSDANRYRTREEIAEWREKRDAIDRMENYMLAHGFTKAELAKIDEETAEDIEAALAFAEQSEMPPLSSLETDVYA